MNTILSRVHLRNLRFNNLLTLAPLTVMMTSRTGRLPPFLLPGYNSRMTTTLTVTYDGRVLIPTSPVNLPHGTPLKVQVGVGAFSPHPLQSLAALVESMPALPGPRADGAAQHDHYLYGAPKQP